MYLEKKDRGNEVWEGESNFIKDIDCNEVSKRKEKRQKKFKKNSS